MTAGAVSLAFVAGFLSILSPCVLPIVPIVLGAAASEHRWGYVALAGGLSGSFVALGLFAATIGYSIGLDATVFRIHRRRAHGRAWSNSASAALSSAVGARRGTACEFERAVSRARAAGRSSRSNFDRAAAGRSLEPVCRPHPWSGIASGGAGTRSASSCFGDVCLRSRSGVAVAGTWHVLARDYLAMAQTHTLSGPTNKSRARITVYIHRRACVVRA